jgi:hypothetical protein
MSAPTKAIAAAQAAWQLLARLEPPDIGDTLASLAVAWIDAVAGSDPGPELRSSRPSRAQSLTAWSGATPWWRAMTEPAETAAPEWRIVRVLPASDSPLSIATAAYLNDNAGPGQPARARVLERLGRAVSRLLRECGVRVPAARPAPDAAQGADRPKV